jgi:hypothetical protein
MPNWCANGLQITATTEEQKEKLKELSEYVKNDNKLISFFYPCPPELMETTAGFFGDTEEQKQLELKQESNLEKYGAKDWYDWQVANWGTKWDPDLHDFTFDIDCFECFFDSAWSPPIEFYNKLVEEGYLVTATYNEGGCDFIGWYDDGDDNCLSWSEIRDEYEEQFTQLQDSPKPENEDSDERWEWNSMLTDFSQEKFFEDQGLSELTPNGWGG